MSKFSINLLYRYICKNIAESSNRIIFKEVFINGSFADLKKQERFVLYYLQMKKHIDKENELLQSYNINVIRDSRKEIEAVAKKVGLEI